MVRGRGGKDGAGEVAGVDGRLEATLETLPDWLAGWRAHDTLAVWPLTHTHANRVKRRLHPHTNNTPLYEHKK